MFIMFVELYPSEISGRYITLKKSGSHGLPVCPVPGIQRGYPFSLLNYIKKYVKGNLVKGRQ
jgi:hypothetical protein